jgi:hypothetical protein
LFFSFFFLDTCRRSALRMRATLDDTIRRSCERQQ